MNQKDKALLAAAQRALHTAGRMWHRADRHAGDYETCENRTCYWTNPALTQREAQ